MEDKKTSVENKNQTSSIEQANLSENTENTKISEEPKSNNLSAENVENVDKTLSEEQENNIEDEKKLLIEKVEKLEQQNNELSDKYLRLLAEYDNFRKRVRKEKDDLVKYTGEETWKKILPILDDFERAIKENENTNDIETIKKGFELIYNKLKHITTQNKIVPIESLHKPFDPETMEAVAKVPASSEDMKGKVIDELEKAYLLNDKLIRYAKVVVAE